MSNSSYDEMSFSLKMLSVNYQTEVVADQSKYKVLSQRYIELKVFVKSIDCINR